MLRPDAPNNVIEEASGTMVLGRSGGFRICLRQDVKGSKKLAAFGRSPRSRVRQCSEFA